jgi:hypothetical protein
VHTYIGYPHCDAEQEAEKDFFVTSEHSFAC